MKEREPIQPEALLPKHEALPYLKKIDGLSTDDLQLVLTLSNAAGTEDVASVIMNTVHLARKLFRQEEITREDEAILRHEILGYEEARKRLAEKGILPEDATLADINVGDPLPARLKMTREEFITHAKQLITRTRALQDPNEELRTDLQSIQDKVSPEQYARLLALLDLNVDGENIELMDKDPHSAKRKLLSEVGKRLSGIWRNFVDMNPWADTALAADITETAGVTKGRATVDAIQSQVDAATISIEKIREGKVPVHILNELILRAEPELGDFMTKRLLDLVHQQPFPGDAVADALSAYFARHKTD